MPKADSNTNTKAKPRGKPFTKDDPRRTSTFAERPQDVNRTGQRNAAAVAFSASIRQQIVAIGEESAGTKDGKTISRIEAVVRRVYQQAIEGNADARDFIVERVEGKVSQKAELTGADGGALQVETNTKHEFSPGSIFAILAECGVVAPGIEPGSHPANVALDTADTD